MLHPELCCEIHEVGRDDIRYADAVLRCISLALRPVLEWARDQRRIQPKFFRGSEIVHVGHYHHDLSWRGDRAAHVLAAPLSYTSCEGVQLERGLPFCVCRRARVQLLTCILSSVPRKRLPIFTCSYDAFRKFFCNYRYA